MRKPGKHHNSTRVIKKRSIISEVSVDEDLLLSSLPNERINADYKRDPTSEAAMVRAVLSVRAGRIWQRARIWKKQDLERAVMC